MKQYHHRSTLTDVDLESPSLANRQHLLLIIAPKDLPQRARREPAVLLDVRAPHNLHRIPPDLWKVRREDASKEVRNRVFGDKFEEPREGVQTGAFSTSGVGALGESVEGDGGLEKGRVEDVEGQEFGRPDDVGVAQVREDVVGPEFGLVGGRDGRIVHSCIVIELVE